ncbi:MAG: hypothetical protein JSV58_01200, partial [Candidatus Bathyarchaeota archaeon]
MRRLLVIASILMISGVFPVASVSGLPVFFVGMQAKYEFILEVTSDGQIACRTSAIRNWTILEVGKNVAKADVQVELLYLNGSVPEPVKDWYDPSQNVGVREIMTFNLNESGWGFYLNNTATDLMRYEVGEESFESKVGEVGCYHLQVRNPNQRWDAFHDLATGILIH